MAKGQVAHHDGWGYVVSGGPNAETMGVRLLKVEEVLLTVERFKRNMADTGLVIERAKFKMRVWGLEHALVGEARSELFLDVYQEMIDLKRPSCWRLKGALYIESMPVFCEFLYNSFSRVGYFELGFDEFIHAIVQSKSVKFA